MKREMLVKTESVDMNSGRAGGSDGQAGAKKQMRL